MSSSVIISVRLHDGRYHGSGEGPPSPARLFQALLAGVGLSGPVAPKDLDALTWLEERNPPVIASPFMRDGQSIMSYVPNNDLDAVAGDPRRIGKIRTGKTIRPRMFDAELPWLYTWAIDEDDNSIRQAQAVCELAERLYQFGRGVDMAWAWGEVIGSEAIETRLSSYTGMVYRPSSSGSDMKCECPGPGSLKSLMERYAANSHRFRFEGHGTLARQLFAQPPKPHFVQVAYDAPFSRYIYDLQSTNDVSIGVWPLTQISKLVEWLRDGASQKLRRALPTLSAEIERVMVGRKADGADEGVTASRVRITPLPSIGHHHADRGIRRVMVEVPADCPIRADDVQWAFSGLEPSDPATGEVAGMVLTPSTDTSMLGHFGATDRGRSRVWRTVTPAALPTHAKRRRIEPTRMTAEAKNGAERSTEQTRAGAAVAQALRHAGIRTSVEAVRVQREPFEANGDRVEAFAPGTRFEKERLWHVEITFNAPIGGPLVIGDGRFLGLGVMAPLEQSQGVHSFVIENGLAANAQAGELARALRRAVMARVQVVLGDRAKLPSFFTGHGSADSAAQTNHQHLTFLFDPRIPRLLIIAPHLLDRREPTDKESKHLASLDAALVGFGELRAGASGRLTVQATPIDADADPLFAASRRWESMTPYQVTRHTKHVGASEALSTDLRAECRRQGLPDPHITPHESYGVAGIGLVGKALLTFKVAVHGPIVLGRDRHLGGGVFTIATALTTEGDESSVIARR
jgi:CRISPR-associated protein Csb2